MDSAMIQLLVLAGIAVFLIVKLMSVLGTRDGFEGPPASDMKEPMNNTQKFEVIEGGSDQDITDHADEDSETAKALAKIKSKESSFNVDEFLQGAKGAYEMILMAFENGNLEDVAPFLSEDVYEAFAQAIDIRTDQGLTVEAEFAGVRGTSLADASFNQKTGSAEITVNFVGELISVVRDKKDKVIEGTPGKAKKQKDSWTFQRKIGSNDPNWRLVATGE